MNISTNNQNKIKIQKIGKVLKIDKDGFLIKKASLKLIELDWLKAVKTTVDKYKKEFGVNINSIYVRGSIAQGTAIKGISDLDMIIIFNKIVSEKDEKIALKIERMLKKEFPLIKYYNINLTTLEKVKNSKKLSFFLKIQSVCVYGQDASVELPKVKPGKDTAIHSSYLKLIFENRRAEILKIKNKEQIKNSCSALMKVILRVGYELIAKKEKAFTRDLYFCYKGFIKYYPEKNEEMYKVLDLALNPTSDKKEIFNIMIIFEDWLMNEIRKSGLV